MIEKIRQINSALTNNVDAKKVNETDIENVAERMACFKDAFDDIHPGIPIESVARYRMINHIMLLNTSKADITDWLALIKKHEIENFSIVKDKCPIGSVEGVLYVPKDRSRKQSTLKYINERYFNDFKKRNPVDIYDQTINEQGGVYYTGGKKIDKVVILFDNIQNGKSTKETIDKYINQKGKQTSDEIVTFECKGKVVTLSQILKANNCKIEIFSIYAGDLGIKNVKDYVNKKYSKMNIVVLEPLEKLTAVANAEDIELMQKMYPGKLAGKIGEGNYLVIREFNQPKLNIMCHKLLEIERVVALFCKRAELQ